MISPILNVGNNHNSDLPDIIQAAYAGDAELVRKLIEGGIDVNTVDPGDNLTPLHIACIQGDESLARVVLDFAKATGKVNFSIRSSYLPRLAWEYAIDRNFYELGMLVHRATLQAQGAGPKPAVA